jgi:hypothetical protein
VVGAGQRRERRHGPLDVRFLDVGVGFFAAFQQRVPAERRDDPHGCGAIVATISALMVCSLFSAWSKTMEAGDLKTSSLTSSASRPLVVNLLLDLGVAIMQGGQAVRELDCGVAQGLDALLPAEIGLLQQAASAQVHSVPLTIHPGLLAS